MLAEIGTMIFYILLRDILYFKLCKNENNIICFKPV